MELEHADTASAVPRARAVDDDTQPGLKVLADDDASNSGYDSSACQAHPLHYGQRTMPREVERGNPGR